MHTHSLSSLRASILAAPLFLAISASSAPAQSIWRVDGTVTGPQDGLTWATAFSHLDTALRAAAASAGADQVWVRALGTTAYTPTPPAPPANPRSATFTVEPQTEVYGGFAGTETLLSQRNPALFDATLLSGDIGIANDTTDNAYHVITTWGVARIDGFQIIRGNANGSGADGRGGGVYCTIVVQGGIGTGAQLELFNANLQYNEAAQGGALYAMLGTVGMRRCRFIHNSASNGGAIYGQTITIRGDNCYFDENGASANGGAIHLASIGQYSGGAPKVQFHNGLFHANFAHRGGAVYMGGSQYSSGKGLFGTCTFTNNVAGDLGGGLYAQSSTQVPALSVIDNSIVWGNVALNGGNELYGRHTVTYSDAPASGAGNFYANPLFGGPSGFEPQAGSPCVDAGNTASLAGDALDLNDNGVTAEPLPFDIDNGARVLGLALDCGAWEL